MHRRVLALSVALLAGSAPLLAAAGLVPPPADTLWPQWQARVALQAGAVAPLTAPQLVDAGAQQRALQGGAVFGDYYFARPSFGSFRASGGLLVGPQGGLPLTSTRAGPRLGVALNSALAQPPSPGVDGPGTVPYLGLGFSSAAWRNSLAITADVGLVAERPGAARGIFGTQALDGALREMRLLPVLQLGVRYSF